MKGQRCGGRWAIALVGRSGGGRILVGRRSRRSRSGAAAGDVLKRGVCRAGVR